jgi:hypothetical protein
VRTVGIKLTSRAHHSRTVEPPAIASAELVERWLCHPNDLFAEVTGTAVSPVQSPHRPGKKASSWELNAAGLAIAG